MKRSWVPLIAAVALVGATPSFAGAQPPAPSDSPTVMLVIDTSGSMAGTRLGQAKSALNSSVNALAPGQDAGLRSYGGSCGDGGILRVPIGADNRDQLRSEIAALTANGSTPTPDALEAGVADLAGVTGPRAMILVSDGQSTCGDPCPTAARIADEEGIDFKVHAVGFQAPDAAEGELACIARETGGEYFSVDDEEGLRNAIGDVIGGGGGETYEYVAVGDSTTTGFSVETCDENRQVSPFGCINTPPSTPFPEHLAADGGPSVDDLERVGIWGYTIREAVADAERPQNASGPWEPQLVAASKATELVTVNLGINDMDFSDIPFWLGQCVGIKQKQFFGRVYVEPALRNRSCQDAARARAGEAELQRNLDTMFDRLDAAQQRGAEVVTTLYFNPINEVKQVRFLPDRSCKILHEVANNIVGAMNAELSERANAHGFTVVDLGPAFEGHGSGSEDSFVHGTECDAVGALGGVDFDLGWPPVDFDETKKNVNILFDPHPNSDGTRAQADAILDAIGRGTP